MSDDARFELFSERERAMISLGLCLFLMDRALGIVGGPAPPEELGRELPEIVGLIDEIGASVDLPGIDPDLVEHVLAKLRSMPVYGRAKRRLGE